MLTPQHGPQEQTLDLLAAMVRLMADPEASAHRIAEMRDAAAEARQAAEAAAKSVDEAKAERERIESEQTQALADIERSKRAIADAQAKLERVIAHEKQVTDALDARRKELDDRENQIAAREAKDQEEAEAMGRFYAEREQVLNDRAKVLDERDALSKQTLAQAEQLRGEYEAKVAKLREVTGA